jgi:hypothetical protein
VTSTFEALHSRPLSYDGMFTLYHSVLIWRIRRESNPLPQPSQGCVLSGELRTHGWRPRIRT